MLGSFYFIPLFKDIFTDQVVQFSFINLLIEKDFLFVNAGAGVTILKKSKQSLADDSNFNQKGDI